MPERILVADDQEEIQNLLRDMLEQRGAEVTTVGAAQEALDLVVADTDAYDLVILDYDFGERQMNGLACLEEIRKSAAALPVIILTGKGTVSMAAESIKLGAEEFVEKNFYLEENMELALMRLDNLIRTTIDNKRLRREREFYREELRGKYNIVGNSRPIRQLIQQIQEVARIPRPVLIRGERGTGKELVAAAIHHDSPRKKNAFMTINCAALAEGLLECELFGQEDNAFTNSSFREGRFVLADKGTLFLDEIGNMSYEFQQKILRILEYQQFERVGGTKTLKVDVRILAATNSDLESDMQQGKFREDLYDRLAFETIWLPRYASAAKTSNFCVTTLWNDWGLKSPASSPRNCCPRLLIASTLIIGTAMCVNSSMLLSRSLIKSKVTQFPYIICRRKFSRRITLKLTNNR